MVKQNGRLLRLRKYEVEYVSDQEKELLEENEEDLVVVITDEEGNEFYYREEMIIPVGDQKFALLVSVHDCEDEECECEEDDAILAKVIIGEDGKEEYIDPTDEEFEVARKAYEKILEEEDEEE